MTTRESAAVRKLKRARANGKAGPVAMTVIWGSIAIFGALFWAGVIAALLGLLP